MECFDAEGSSATSKHCLVSVWLFLIASLVALRHLEGGKKKKNNKAWKDDESTVRLRKKTFCVVGGMAVARPLMWMAGGSDASVSHISNI